MRNTVNSQLKYFGIVSLLALQGACGARSALAACYSTPDMAVDAITSSQLSRASDSRGYRVVKIQSDPILGKSWAMIASCGHPEWPARALPTTVTSQGRAPGAVELLLAKSAKAVPVVRAGDVVRVWRQESLLRIEVAGVSEENGDLGQTIRVRLLRRNNDDQSVQEQFSGIVRGPSNVEIPL
jgi:hypothetical protein